MNYYLQNVNDECKEYQGKGIEKNKNKVVSFAEKS
jgi:hypothetical protein